MQLPRGCPPEPTYKQLPPGMQLPPGCQIFVPWLEVPRAAIGRQVAVGAVGQRQRCGIGWEASHQHVTVAREVPHQHVGGNVVSDEAAQPRGQRRYFGVGGHRGGVVGGGGGKASLGVVGISALLWGIAG